MHATFAHDIARMHDFFIANQSYNLGTSGIVYHRNFRIDFDVHNPCIFESVSMDSFHHQMNSYGEHY